MEKMLSIRELPGMKIVRSWRFPREAIDEWVRERDNRYRAPTPPMDKETEDAMRSLGYLH